MKTLRLILAAFLAASVLTLTARATDLSGDWKWTSQSTTGPVQMSAMLVQKDGNLTGTVTGRQGPAEISDAVIKDSVVTFTVVRGVEPNVVTFLYTGTIAGDTITGTIVRTIAGSTPLKSEWKASRGK